MHAGKSKLKSHNYLFNNSMNSDEVRDRAIFKTRSPKTQLGDLVSFAKIAGMTLQPSRWKKILCPFNISKPFGKLKAMVFPPSGQ